MGLLTKNIMHRSEIRKHIEANQGFIIINEFFLLFIIPSGMCQIVQKQQNMLFYLWFIYSVPIAGGGGQGEAPLSPYWDATVCHNVFIK